LSAPCKSFTLSELFLSTSTSKAEIITLAWDSENSLASLASAKAVLFSVTRLLAIEVSSAISSHEILLPSNVDQSTAVISFFEFVQILPSIELSATDSPRSLSILTVKN
jgi:hypothetical protein